MVRGLEENQGVLSHLLWPKAQTALTKLFLTDVHLTLPSGSRTASLYSLFRKLFEAFTVLRMRELNLMSTWSVPCCHGSPLFLGHTGAIIYFPFIAGFNRFIDNTHISTAALAPSPVLPFFAQPS